MISRLPAAAEPRLNPSTVLAIVIAGPGAWIAVVAIIPWLWSLQP